MRFGVREVPVIFPRQGIQNWCFESSVRLGRVATVPGRLNGRSRPSAEALPEQRRGVARVGVLGGNAVLGAGRGVVRLEGRSTAWEIALQKLHL